MKKKIIITLLFLAITGGLFFALTPKSHETTDSATIEANIVPLSSKISGYVTTLNINDNQKVKKGDVLLEIDASDYKLALALAEADLKAAEAKLAMGQHEHTSTSISAPSNVASAQSILESTMAEWNNAEKNLKRLQNISEIARSKQQLDDAIALEKSTRSKVADAKARLQSAGVAPETIAASTANIKQLEAGVERATAAVEKAKQDLAHTKIIAPEDGYIARKSVENGAYIQPGQQLASLVGNHFWVIANFKENQLKNIKPRQKAEIEIDAYKGRTFNAHVDSIQAGTGSRFSLFPPENATGNFVKIVQRVPVKIVFDEKLPEDLNIGAGMSVEPTVSVK